MYLPLLSYTLLQRLVELAADLLFSFKDFTYRAD